MAYDGVQCNNQHSLSITEDRWWSCDVCGLGNDGGDTPQPGLSCIPCDYDVCFGCAENMLACGRDHGDDGRPGRELSPHQALRVEKEALVHTVSAALIKEPAAEDKGQGGLSPVAADMLAAVRSIGRSDPEFILKLALYVRADLGLRGTANLLVAFAVGQPAALKYLAAYLPAIVALPSDWLQIATFVRDLPLGAAHGSKGMPNALRTALAATFAKFNEHSLAKYDKAGSQKKKAKAAKEAAAKEGREVQAEKQPYTLKQMIRMLHIDGPHYAVMALLGKRYPATAEEFEALGLGADDRSFEPARAGTRMRLPIPTTWETQLSSRGNSAAVWEELVATRQLPFMAMLRNLRNIICAGCSRATHETLLGRLRSADQVGGSKQFPYRFFSAYDAVDIDFSKVFGTAAEIEAEAKKKKPKLKPGERPPAKLKPFPPDDRRPTAELLQEYKQALDKAVQLATTLNIRPIHGATLVVVNVAEMWRNVTAGGGKGIGSARRYVDLAVLLGLMFHYACEQCTLLFYSSESANPPVLLPLERDGKILENMQHVLEALAPLNENFNPSAPFPYGFMERVALRRRVDALVVLDTNLTAYRCDRAEAANGSGALGATLPLVLSRMRTALSPELLFVHVNISGGRGGRGGCAEHGYTHPNDVALTGFSDAILRFVGERGAGGPLPYIERIDVAKGIRRELVRHEAGAQVLLRAPDGEATDSDASDGTPTESQTETDTATESDAADEAAPIDCRFFVSSTFLDMAAERDALLQEVFPALRRLCQHHGLRANVSAVDLRWGITAEEAASGLAMQACLEAAAQCAPFYLGVSGDRYGYVPQDRSVDAATLAVPEAELAWLTAAPSGLSMTELELRQAVHSARRAGAASPRLVFLARQVEGGPAPAECRADTAQAPAKVKAMREFAAGCSDVVRCAHYAAPVGSTQDGPRAKATLGMDDFKRVALAQLWAVVQDACAGQPEVAPSDTTPQQQAQRALSRWAGDTEVPYAVSLAARGKHAASDAHADLHAALRGLHGPYGAVLVTGPEGCGKSAVLATASTFFHDDAHVIYAHCGYTAPAALPQQIALELLARFGLHDEFPGAAADTDAAVTALPDLYRAAATFAPVVVYLDTDGGEEEALLPLLAAVVPTAAAIGSATNRHVRFFVAARSGSRVAAALRPRAVALTPPALALEDRARVLTQHLRVAGKRVTATATTGGGTGSLFATVVRRSDAASPGYLVAAAAYLELFATHDTLRDDVRAVPGSLAGIQRQVLERLEARHGAATCRGVLPAVLLAGAVGGCPEAVLLELGASPLKVRSLLYGLDTAVAWQRQGGAVTFRSAALAAAVKKRYCVGAAEERVSHAAIAAVYERRCGFVMASAQTAPTVRHEALTPLETVCLLHHAVGAKRSDTARALLSNVGCLESVTRGRLLPRLLIAAEALKAADRVAAKACAPFVAFLVAHRHILQRHPDLALQCALNATPRSRVWRAAQAVTERPEWVAWRNADEHGERHCQQTIRPTTRPLLCADIDTAGRRVALGGRDMLCRVLGLQDGAVQRKLQHPSDVTAVVLLPGNVCVTGAEDGAVRTWSLQDGALLTRGVGHTRRVNAVAAHPSGDFLLTASDDGSLRVWRGRSDASRSDTVRPASALYHHHAPVASCAVHTGGVLCASGGWEGRAAVWRRDATNRVTWFHCRRKAAVRAVAFTPRMAPTLAVATYDGKVDLFDVASEVHQATFDQHIAAPITSIAFSTDAAKMLTADAAGVVKVWRASVTGEVVASFGAHAAAVTCATFDPTSSRGLLTASEGGEARQWVADDAEELIPCAHGGAVTCAAAAADGSFVVTGSVDGRCHFLEVAGGKRRVAFACAHDGAAVTAVAVFQAAGHADVFYTGDSRGVVRAWRAAAGIGGNDGSCLWRCDPGSKVAAVPVAALSATAGGVTAMWVNGRAGRVTGETAPAVHIVGRGGITRGAGFGDKVLFGTYAGALGRAEEDGTAACPAVQNQGTWVTAVAATDVVVAAGTRDGNVALLIHGDDETSHMRFAAEYAAENEAVAGGPRPTVTDIAFLEQPRLAAAFSDGTIHVLALTDAGELRRDLIFYASSAVTALAAHHPTSTLTAGDALGNVYTLALSPAAAAEETERRWVAAAVDAAADAPAMSAAFVQKFAAALGVAGAGAQAEAEEQGAARWAVLHETVRPGMTIPDKRAFLQRQRATLKLALKLQRTDAVAREAIRAHSLRTAETFMSIQRMAQGAF